MTERPASDAAGHRSRLRKRFLDAGPGALADYEMLELLLFQAVPRRDTKPLAKALIAKFGSYRGVLRADVEALLQVKGMGEPGAVLFRAVADAAERLARHEVIGQPVLSSWDKVLDYLRISMVDEDTERFRILFLDIKNKLIKDELQQRGTVNHTPVYPREVVRRALELGASALIIVSMVRHMLEISARPLGSACPRMVETILCCSPRSVGTPHASPPSRFPARLPLERRRRAPVRPLPLVRPRGHLRGR